MEFIFVLHGTVFAGWARILLHKHLPLKACESPREKHVSADQFGGLQDQVLDSSSCIIQVVTADIQIRAVMGYFATTLDVIEVMTSFAILN